MGILALANMVPQTGPDSVDGREFHKHSLIGFWYLILFLANVPDWLSLALKAFWDV